MLWAGLCGVEDLQSMADHRLMVIDVRHNDDHHSGYHRIWSASMVFLTFSILELKSRFLVDLNAPVLKASGVVID